MSEPIDYLVPLPAGQNLRYLELTDGIRISRDKVSRFALWREALVPAIAIPLLTAAEIYQIWLGMGYWISRQPNRMFVPVVFAILLPFALCRIIRDAWQNSGIVTAVSVTPEKLFWSKRTLWGSREHFWPLDSVKRADFDKFNRVLKIHRTNGPPLVLCQTSNLG